MRYWLIKSEPDVYGIDALARDKTTPWTGVRNYQARNFMRDQMKLGDQAFYYHSNCDEPGIVGIAEVSKAGGRVDTFGGLETSRKHRGCSCCHVQAMKLVDEDDDDECNGYDGLEEIDK